MENQAKQSITVSQLVYLILKKIFLTILRMIWIFIRMTMYYAVKLLDKIFDFNEIEISRERANFNNQEALTTIKHEFIFDKSDKFLDKWMYFRDLMYDLELSEDEKAELVDYVLGMIAEAERQAFNTTYNYMMSKNLKEPSFEDMVIQGIFKSNKEFCVRDRVENPFKKQKSTELFLKRRKKKEQNWH